MQFTIVSSADAAAEGCVTITDGGPKRRRGTCHDLRMGTPEGVVCPTCASKDCLGHPGRIVLPVPVPNLEFQRRLLGVLNAVCYCCSRLRLQRSSPEYHHAAQRTGTWARNKQKAKVDEAWKRITKAAEAIPICAPVPDPTASPCYNPDAGCGALQPFWEVDGGLCLRAIFPESPAPALTIEDVAKCLRNISSEDAKDLAIEGGAESMLWRILPLLPNQLRFEEGRKESDLSAQLRRIVRVSATVKQSGILSCVAGRRAKVDPAYRLLCQLVAKYQNSDIRPDGNIAYGPEQSIRSRLGRRKQAKIRSVAGSKRMRWTGRFVVSPTTLLHVREVGVPEFVCMRFTYPMRVQAYNLDLARKLVQNGPTVYPGAHPPAHGGPVKIGDVVERHLLRGDPVLINRQPTLGVASMRAHLVVPQKRSSHTLELHIGVVTGYGMDFDGDEANIMIPRTEEARAEAKELMLVDHLMLRDGIPFGVTFNQSGILGAHVLTLPDTVVSRKHLGQMLMLDPYFENALDDLASRPEQEFGGREVFSQFLPPYLSLHCGGVVIESNDCVSVMTAGTWTAASLNGPAGLIACIHEKYGGPYAANFFTAVYRACSWYLSHVRPVTVTYEDCCTGEGGLKMMVVSGSKGKPENITQLRDSLGQQHDHKGRPLPNGVVNSGFARSLSPWEHYMHLAGSRAAMTDTTLWTSESGYLTRQAAKILEDLVLSYDPSGAVVNSEGKVIMKNYTSSAHSVPGDMVGLHAAYAVLGPCTQLNLKTFHASGSSNTLVTGIPRLKQLLWVTAPDLVAVRRRPAEAKALFVREVILALKSVGMEVDKAHVQLIAETMASTGEMLPITHVGAKRQKFNTLRLAGFERSAEVLLSAAAQGLTDPLRGPWERMLFNRRFEGGTGYFELRDAPKPVDQPADRPVWAVWAPK